MSFLCQLVARSAAENSPQSIARRSFAGSWELDWLEFPLLSPAGKVALSLLQAVAAPGLPHWTYNPGTWLARLLGRAPGGLAGGGALAWGGRLGAALCLPDSQPNFSSRWGAGGLRAGEKGGAECSKGALEVPPKHGLLLRLFCSRRCLERARSAGECRVPHLLTTCGFFPGLVGGLGALAGVTGGVGKS